MNNVRKERESGLTARNQSELDNHISYSHRGTANSPSIKSSEQKKHPFPSCLELISC
jgi:hypothetical protein